MTKKKLWSLSILLLAVIICTVGAVYAYLAANNTKTNTINIGHGDEKVQKIFSSPERQTLSSNHVQKEVKIKNEGETDCYVRVYVALSDSDLKDKVKIACTENGQYYTLAEFKTELQKDEQTLNQNWKYIPEDESHPYTGGYFYYTQKCDVNAETTPLFSRVQTDHSTGESFVSGNDAEDFIKNYNLIIYSETVQTIDHGNEATWEQAWKKFLRENTN